MKLILTILLLLSALTYSNAQTDYVHTRGTVYKGTISKVTDKGVKLERRAKYISLQSIDSVGFTERLNSRSFIYDQLSKKNIPFGFAEVRQLQNKFSGNLDASQIDRNSKRISVINTQLLAFNKQRNAGKTSQLAGYLLTILGVVAESDEMFIAGGLGVLVG